MSLSASGLGVRINGATIIEDISLDVSPGEVVAVIGPNGAGKSTVMKALAGDIALTSGAIRLGQRSLDDWPARDLARIRAVLPQQSTLTFPFTVLQVALMGRNPHIRGVESADDYAIARSALSKARIAHLEDRVYTSLSGGERQRVQLARVLAQIWADNGDSRYLLLDEPTNSLDLTHQHSTLDVAREFAKQGVGVLAVLHDLNLAAQYADRVIVLDRGRQVVSGAPRAVFTPEMLESVFRIPVIISDHPHLPCPLIIPIPVGRHGMPDADGPLSESFDAL